MVGPKGAKGLCPKHYQAERLHSTAPPCSVDGCEKRSQTRGMCPMHYQRARLRGDVGGAEAERQRNVGVCSVEGCGQPMRKRGWCASHYAQWYKATRAKPFVEKRERNAGECSVEGCDQPSQTRGWCGSHYSQWYRSGQVRPFLYKWAAERKCLVCGKTDWPGNGRRYCSSACQQMYRRMTGRAPAINIRPTDHTTTCQQCDSLIDLNQTGKAGRRKRSDTLVCDPCRRAKSTRHGISVSVLYRRDGDKCGICSERIDMTLTAPHLFRASVDHVIPYARGGPHSLENTQLAHLWCNQVKHTREGFVI